MNDTKVVKTRKEHRCAGCYRRFPSGSKLTAWTFLDASGDSGWCTWYICPVCTAVQNETECADLDGAYYEGFAIEPDREYWGKRRAEIEDISTTEGEK